MNDGINDATLRTLTGCGVRSYEVWARGEYVGRYSTVRAARTAYAKAYNAGEAVRLFTPAPEPMKGQTTLSL